MNNSHDARSSADDCQAIRLFSLGAFAIEIDGVALTFSAKAPKKDLALIKALIAIGPNGAPESYIADRLWPQAEGDKQANCLKQASYRVRKLLRYADAIRVRAGTLALNADRVMVDAWAFERHVVTRFELSSDSGRQEQHARDTLTLYRGGFLEGDGECACIFATRERLRASFWDAILHCAIKLEQGGEYARAREIYRDALAVDPVVEEFYQGLMRCHMRLGEPARGLMVYERLLKLLATNWRTQPSAASKELFRVLHDIATKPVTRSVAAEG